MLEPTDILQLITNHCATTCPLDPIPSAVLQSISGDLLPYLSSTINSSLASGIVPPVFKCARVTSLLKKTSLDPSSVKNYRPVSLLPFLSKALERAVLYQLSSFLQQHNLLDPHQSGFQSGHSTETALLAVIDALATTRTSSLSFVLILLNLSAAFDTVNHQLLISTLAEMGISGTALSWIASYLADRSYQVAWRGSVSAPHPLLTGVSQGSVLGPLLFSLYTKSLGSIIKSHGFSYHCYADDTQLFLSFPPSATQVNEEISACLADISLWMARYHLKLNLDKTELLYIPHRTSPLPELSVTVAGTTVTASCSARNLGVVLDDQLDFKEQVVVMSWSCRFILYNIRRILTYLITYSTQLLVQAMVISRLDYCNSLVASLPACIIQPLQLIQSAVAHLVFNLPKFSHVTPLLQLLHWLPVAARIRFKVLTLAYAAANKTAPHDLQDIIQAYTPAPQGIIQAYTPAPQGIIQAYTPAPQGIIQAYTPAPQGIIQAYTPAQPLCSAATGHLAQPSGRATVSHSSRLQSFSILTPQWWNDLPIPIRTAPSLPIFRRSLKTHLFTLYLDSSSGDS